MAEQTPAEKAEAARRKALSPEARAEEDRRASLSQDERDQEDKDELESLNDQIADEKEANGRERFTGKEAVQRRAIIEKRIAERNAALYDESATESVVVARGRTIVAGPAHRQVEYTQGATLNVTPEEAAKLRQSGHVQRDDGNIAPEAGPRVYQEAGLILGNGAGQGQGGSKN
jgi:hypothetical protein